MLNRAVVMGRLTDTPELRHTSSNIPVTTFTLAVERNYRSGDERVTDFLDIVAWRNTADFVSKYFTKGMQVAVEGSIQVRNYTDRDGNKRRAWEIIADQVYFADSKRDNGYSNAGAAPRTDNQPAPAFNNAGADDFTEFDGGDDLPF